MTKKKTTKKPVSKVARLLGKDFRWSGIDYDYKAGRHSCKCGDDYCRCGTVENAHVTDIDMEQLAESISQNLSEIDQYCVDRVLSIYKVWDKSKWNVAVEAGYYGEEIGEVTLNEDLATKVDFRIEEVLSFETTSAKIEALLVLEYGYLLPELRGRCYNLTNIPKDDIVSQREHYVKLDREIVESYTDYKLPRGIVVPVSTTPFKYRLIDGYHRVAATKDFVRVFYAT
jgi:hypothetical protein